MAVITISKEYGTQSVELAEKLAEMLGYEYVGKELLAEIAKKLNISENEAEIFKKASSSRILRLVDKYTCSIVQKVVDREHGCLNDENYYQTTKNLVESLHEAGNMIILGWGGQCILKGRNNVLHVRLIKGMDAKVPELMKKSRLGADAAKRMIESEENDMRAYIKQYFQADWNDARLYDLVIDMGKNTVEQATQTICDNLKARNLS